MVIGDQDRFVHTPPIRPGILHTHCGLLICRVSVTQGTARVLWGNMAFAPATTLNTPPDIL